MGEGSWFDPDGTYSFGSIGVGNCSNLGVRPIVMASRAGIRIGSYVMFVPEVTIRGGSIESTLWASR